MPDTLQVVVLLLVGGLLLLALVIFFASLYLFRRGRRAPYWRWRRSAALQGWQLFLVALTMAFVAAAVCLFSGFANFVLEDAAPTPGGELTGDAAAVPATQTAPLSPAVTQTRSDETPAGPTTASATPPIPSPTAAGTGLFSPTAVPPTPETPTQSARTPGAAATAAPGFTLTFIDSSVTPGPDARFEITALADEITNTFFPVDPATTFDVGITRIYFWVAYTGMADGLGWARVLARDDVPVQGGAYLWAAGQSGEEVFFFGDADGLPAGDYTIQLYIGEAVAAEAEFTIR